MKISLKFKDLEVSVEDNVSYPRTVEETAQKLLDEMIKKFSPEFLVERKL